ncbi:Acetyltransferase (isoleucine patch superfamily) [Selenomonas sp. GACV-9]|uniref:acyltransferase n=1 Tax=Selenomonas sp. GACV-9 TaxID=3158782 RepID=UPI0008E7109B|nr:Acetyltransferase (isoleucine patch superfamily) [Selenomonas ruminantium]
MIGKLLSYVRRKYYSIYSRMYVSILKKMYAPYIYIERVSIRPGFHVIIENNATLKIGKDCFFNYNCSITALNHIEIGDDCIFGENVKIYDHNHRFSDNTQLIHKQGFSIKEVSIGNNCWIGSGVKILAGSKIGDNCVIGANVVVNGEICSNSVVKNCGDYVIETRR